MGGAEICRPSITASLLSRSRKASPSARRNWKPINGLRPQKTPTPTATPRRAAEECSALRASNRPRRLATKPARLRGKACKLRDLALVLRDERVAVVPDVAGEH